MSKAKCKCSQVSFKTDWATTASHYRLNFKTVYFLGKDPKKKVRGNMRANNNHGFDDENGEYKVVIGDHIAYRYELTDKLGAGSFGQVLKCHDHKTNTDVALKLVRNKKRFFKQAQVEVDLLVKIRDADPDDRSSIIHVQDNFVFRQHFCIAFPILSVNLYEATKLNKFQGFPLPLIRKIAAQMLGSLRFLRALRMVHCDLKPENILLERPGHSAIRVIDLGSGCYEDQRVYTYIQSRFYRAPEVILGLPYGHPIDMWSFACILSELYTGWPLFPGTNEHEQLLCIMEVFGTPPPSLLATAKRANRFFDEDGEPIVVPFKGRMRLPGARTLQRAIDRKRPCQDAEFVDFLAACLAWQPHERLTPDEALEHAWMAGAPEALMDKARSAAPRSASPPPEHTPTSPSPFPEESDVEGSEGEGSVQDDTESEAPSTVPKAKTGDAVALAVAAATADSATLDDSVEEGAQGGGASLSLQSSAPPSPTSTARSGVQESALDTVIAQAHAAADAEATRSKKSPVRRAMVASKHAASQVHLPTAAGVAQAAHVAPTGAPSTGAQGGGGMRMSASTSVLPSAVQARRGASGSTAGGHIHHEADGFGGTAGHARQVAEESMPLAHPAAQADRARHRQTQELSAHAKATSTDAQEDATGVMAPSVSVASFALPAFASLGSDTSPPEVHSSASSTSLYRSTSGVSPSLQPYAHASSTSTSSTTAVNSAHLAPLPSAAVSKGSYGLSRGGARAAAVTALTANGPAANAVPHLDFSALTSSAQRAHAGAQGGAGGAPLYTSAHHQFVNSHHQQQHLPAVSAHRRHRIQVSTLRRVGSGHHPNTGGGSLTSAGARIASGGGHAQQVPSSMYNLSGRRRVQATGGSLAPLPAPQSGAGGGSPRLPPRQRPEHPTPRAAMGRSTGTLQPMNTLVQPAFQPGTPGGAGTGGGSASARTPSSGGGVRGGSGSSTARAVSHGRAQLAALNQPTHGASAHHVSYLRNSAARNMMPGGGGQAAYAAARSGSLSRVPVRSRHMVGSHSYTRQVRR